MEQIKETKNTKIGQIEIWDRFMEFMEMRHRGAVIASEIEHILGQDIDSIDATQASDPNRENYVQELLRPIFENMERFTNAGLMPKEVVFSKKQAMADVIRAYFKKQLSAKKAEGVLIQKGRAHVSKFDHNKILDSGKAAGRELFIERGQHLPRGTVSVQRREGYLIVLFDNEDDYEELTDQVGGFGQFDHALNGPELGADLLLINKSRAGASVADVVLHERQHFINHSVFGQESDRVGYRLFENIEGVTVGDDNTRLRMGIDGGIYIDRSERIVNGLRDIKDEVLAYIREGSDSSSLTKLLNFHGYDYLKKPFTKKELKELIELMERIRKELDKLTDLINNVAANTILVYHLIDVPLTKFPERIRALRKYYEIKLSDFIPLINLPKVESISKNNIRLRRLIIDLESKKKEAGALMGVRDSFVSITLNYDERMKKFEQLRREVCKEYVEYKKLFEKSRRVAEFQKDIDVLDLQ